METIIIWIVFIAIGALWEFVSKKKGDSRSRSVSDSATPGNRNAAPRVSAPRPAPFTPSAGHHHPQRPKTVYQPMSVGNEQTVSEVEVLTDTPLPDSISDDNILPPPSENGSTGTLSDREEHFRRWRQAIIDTQVLERKF